MIEERVLADGAKKTYVRRLDLRRALPAASIEPNLQAERADDRPNADNYLDSPILLYADRPLLFLLGSVAEAAVRQDSQERPQ